MHTHTTFSSFTAKALIQKWQVLTFTTEMMKSDGNLSTNHSSLEKPMRYNILSLCSPFHHKILGSRHHKGKNIESHLITILMLYNTHEI